MFIDYVCDQPFMKQDGQVETPRTLILGPIDIELHYCKEKCSKMRKCHSIQYCESGNVCRLYNKNSNGKQKLYQRSDPDCSAYNRTCDYGN